MMLPLTSIPSILLPSWFFPAVCTSLAACFVRNAAEISARVRWVMSNRRMVSELAFEERRWHAGR